MKFKKEAIESEKDSEHDGTRSEGGRPSKRQRTDQETRNLAVEIQTTNEQDETNPDEVNFEAPKFNFKGDIFGEQRESAEVFEYGSSHLTEVEVDWKLKYLCDKLQMQGLLEQRENKELNKVLQIKSLRFRALT